MNYMDELNAAWEELDRKDAESKAAGTIVGRYITFPQGDGCAVYIITKQNKKTCRIAAVSIGDNYIQPAIGCTGSVQTELVLRILRNRDQGMFR